MSQGCLGKTWLKSGLAWAPWGGLRTSFWTYVKEAFPCISLFSKLLVQTLQAPGGLSAFSDKGLALCSCDFDKEAILAR